MDSGEHGLSFGRGHIFRNMGRMDNDENYFLSIINEQKFIRKINNVSSGKRELVTGSHVFRNRGKMISDKRENKKICENREKQREYNKFEMVQFEWLEFFQNKIMVDL